MMVKGQSLIDANGNYTLNATDNTGHSLYFSGGIISVMDIRGHCVCEFFSDDAPTVDAVEVVHGRWKYGTRAAVCSECGFERNLDDNYGRAIACPNCGARMDGDGK